MPSAAPLFPQRLGMRVGRTWAFNRGLPNQPGVYDEEQMEALDFVIYAAGRCGGLGGHDERL